MRLPCAVVAAWLTVIAAPVFAQQPEPQPDATELAKKTQNPVGDVTALPFQFNFNTGGDLGDETLLNLNFQPVIPFKLTDNWTMIARTIVPLYSVPSANGISYSGVGDIQQQLFVTPAHPGKLIWGVGPMFSFPTATALPVKTGSWAGGFSAVVLTMPGPWVIGALITQIWPMSDAGGEPETNVFLLQPFVNYNFGGGWALAYSPNITANWDASAGNQWTLPLGLGISRTTVFDSRPMTLSAQYYYNVTRPDGAAGQLLRISVSLLYPRK